MGRTAAKALTAKQVETETRAGYHADGPHTGLYLQVTSVNDRVTRSWVFRFTSPTTRKRRELGLGSTRIRKLADARTLSAELRLKVLNGIDPKDERDKIRALAVTARSNHQTAVVLRLADQALPKVIGPAYWGANKHLGVNAALKTGRAIAWIKNNIENKDSQLCKNFVGTPYEDLVGLRRSRRWWLDLFRLRQKSAE